MQDLAIKPMRQQWTKSKSRELRKEEKKEAAQRAAEIEQKQMLPTGFGCGDLRAPNYRGFWRCFVSRRRSFQQVPPQGR